MPDRTPLTVITGPLGNGGTRGPGSLLFNFLQELVYYKDAEQLLLVVAQVEIARHAGRYRLTATTRGEQLDPARHLRVDVKAVTLHRFRLQQSARGWEALVILDI